MTEKPFEFKVDKWTFRVPRDRFYNENDCWVKLDGSRATVGITDFLQNMASDIIYVELPEPGTVVEQFDEAGSFEAVKIMLDLISPVNGVVKEVNEELLEKPELANQDPYERGWFVKMEVADFDVDRENLLDATGYFEVLKRKVEAERRKGKGKTEG
ncbi:MAG: glycine cleavage system protein GcvH [Candidatus Bathyarchaeota archaeon]|nr:glycine cleavage system protein GcvH [Candidatus Bathyarchaeota archaeon]